ncbi:MAG: TraR/DksA family transcriptional regulator [Deltaproteobacteria bacterium]|nr:TraR/DksA family transcriptional regulator [Deltaproteobacteria bacterium]
MKMRDELLKGIDDIIKTERSSPERDVGDFYDDADIEKGRQMSQLLGERERSKLAAIDNALEKIEDEGYGVCEECGMDINKKRLKIIPYALYCIECQSELEKRAADGKDPEDGSMLYKDVSMSDIEAGDE